MGIQLDSLLRFPDETKPNGFKVLKGKDVIDYLRTIAHSAVSKVISSSDLECGFEQARNVYRNIIKAEPAVHVDELMLWFIVVVQKSLEPLEKKVSETVKNSSSAEAIKKAMGISIFIGHLYNHGLADMKFLDHWMMNVLVGETNKSIRLALMATVAIQLKIFVAEKDDGFVGKECLMRMYKAVCDENIYEEGDDEKVQLMMR